MFNKVIEDKFRFQPWMFMTLVLVGLLYLGVGSSMAIAPRFSLGLLVEQPSPIVNWLWQCLGCLIAVVGVGLLFSCRAEVHSNLFIITVLTSQFAVGLISAGQFSRGAVVGPLFWFSFSMSLAWIIPLGMIVWERIHYEHKLGSAHLEPESDDPLMELRTNTGRLLDDLAEERPQMVVFLRHAGCTFCRQALADIQAGRSQIEATGCGIVLIHLGSEDDPASLQVFTQYGVQDLPRISDPTSRLYRQFGLDLGGFTALFGLRVWVKGLVYGIVNGHGIGSVRGNSFQMPGVYLYHCGVILGGFRHESAADRPDYVTLARQVSMRPSTDERQIGPSPSAI